MDEKGLTASGLCKVLGIGTNQTTNWRQRNTDPPAKYIIPICEYVGCSVAYLLTGLETEKAPVPGMSENGREMLELFELLPDRDQAILIGHLQEMAAPLLGSGQGKKTGSVEAVSSHEKAV